MALNVQSGQSSVRRGGRTRWRKAVLLFAPSLVVVGVLGVGMAQGAIAASFGVSGNSLKFTTGDVEASNVSAFLGTATSTTSSDKPVMLAGIQTALVHGICASSVLDVPVFGTISLKFIANPDQPITATNLTADADSLLTGDGVINGMQAGIDASTLSATPGFKGPAGVFGFQSSSLNATGLKGTAWQAAGGSMKISDMQVQMNQGKVECY
ncbi:DUF6230 family protein [Renibacterium salmoninarum]|nr:DUF6230 family protein [Renibacterium salmoninarum]